MTITELIAALEAAEGPSRELDLDIFEVVAPKSFRKRLWNALGVMPKGSTESDARARVDVPKFTSSLDTALKILPRERHHSEALRMADDIHRWIVRAGPLTLERYRVLVCAAALKILVDEQQRSSANDPQ